MGVNSGFLTGRKAWDIIFTDTEKVVAGRFERQDEKDISAETPKEGQGAWFSETDEDPGGT